MKGNYLVEEKQKYNDREKKDKKRSFKKELKKGEKNECSWKNKVMILLIMVCGNYFKSVN